jgi:hypothetical protein
VATTKSSASTADAHPSTEEKLAKLEERLRHELMDDEERQELRDRVLRLRRRLSR